MFKKIALVCALMLVGCAPAVVAPPVVIPVKAQVPAMQVYSTNNYSISVPSDYTNVKKADDNVLDIVVRSPDSMLVVTTTTDHTADDLPTYAKAFAQEMISNGAELLQVKEGTMGGLPTLLFVMGVNQRYLTLHFLAQDTRVGPTGTVRAANAPKLDMNVYYVSCAINPLMLKDKAAACLEITNSFTLKPMGEEATHVRKLPE